MDFSITRRSAIVGGVALGACAPQREQHTPPDFRRFFEIEQRIGGRIGVAAWDTGADRWLGLRRHELFPMCSTFKWALAAAQLNMAQNGGPQLNEQLRFRERDLLEYAPTAREHLARGWMTIEEACEAATKISDNTAANLLLEIQGGPEGFTRFLRSNGDGVSRLDRNEPGLNDVAPGDERDTTSPVAMAQTLRRFLLEDGVLTAAHREKLIGWMVESPTGRERLRAGFPSDWRVADKTGTWNGEHNAANNVAIAWPPRRAPIIVAAYLHRSIADPTARNAAHAEIARIVTEEWG